MRLLDVSRYFDKTVAVDAYSGRKAFRCQIEPLEMFKTEGTRIKIRSMSATPSATIPSRGVISIGKQRYLITDSSLDYWEGEPIRARFVIQGADETVTVKTIQETLEGLPGKTAYASLDFNKYGTDERDDSNLHAQYHLFFSGAETVGDLSILACDNGKAFLARQSYKTPAGLTDVLADEISFPVTDTATFTSRIYNPITDDYTDTSTTVQCIVLRWQEHFKYLNKSTTKYEAGDRQILMPLSVTPKATDTLEVSGIPWVVLSCIEDSGYWSLHVRRP